MPEYLSGKKNLTGISYYDLNNNDFIDLPDVFEGIMLNFHWVEQLQNKLNFGVN